MFTSKWAGVLSKEKKMPLESMKLSCMWSILIQSSCHLVLLDK